MPPEPRGLNALSAASSPSSSRPDDLQELLCGLKENPSEFICDGVDEDTLSPGFQIQGVDEVSRLDQIKVKQGIANALTEVSL